MKGKFVKGEYLLTIKGVLKDEILKLNEENKDLDPKSKELNWNVDRMWEYRDIVKYLER